MNGSDAEPDGDRYHLRLYVAGQTPKSLAATANLRPNFRTLRF